ncbi:putative c6 zinc finger domain containing protein [Erysiphe necator]|uniref:Putative c6 zinc finger domain containing protein n=1 Tax=Uncinula necator TaxID=52586 RepID=A0A0B1P6U8_UNCNE|nr:putative c6 zinc finger domain containing protein [Erysiphe necator]
MAGPGGGPPRRSHTKSRKGCDTCKRRHIRCDENFPQCRNCTKHNCRCPYMDVTGILPPNLERSISPERADLKWTPKIEEEIVHWQRTGIFPFPDLLDFPETFPQHFSFEDLRLFYHIASISIELGQYNANKFTLWTRQIPLFLKIGINHGFVMHALLAIAATHLSWLTKCSLAASMAYEHRGIAMTGLHEAIGSFSRNNSDAILAASILLSWQENDWRGWMQLIQGTSSVIDAMNPWKDYSEFGEFLADQSTFPITPSPSYPSAKNSQLKKKDFYTLQQAYLQLQRLNLFFEDKDQIFREAIKKLMEFLLNIQRVSSKYTPAQLFETLDPLRTWLFWQPVMFLQQTKRSPLALVTIAHYYAIALVIEPLFPEVGAAYFGSLTLMPIEEIARQLISSSSYQSPGNLTSSLIDMIKYPLEMAARFKDQMEWLQPKKPLPLPPLSYHRNRTNGVKNIPAPLSFLPPSNSKYNYDQEQGQSTPAELLPATPSSLEPLSSPYFAMSSHMHEVFYSPASSNFGGDLGFYSNDSEAEFPHFDGDEYSSCDNFDEYAFPVTTVWN